LCSGGFPQQIIAAIRGLKSHLSVAKKSRWEERQKVLKTFSSFLSKKKRKIEFLKRLFMQAKH